MPYLLFKLANTDYGSAGLVRAGCYEGGRDLAHRDSDLSAMANHRRRIGRSTSAKSTPAENTSKQP